MTTRPAHFPGSSPARSAEAHTMQEPQEYRPEPFSFEGEPARRGGFFHAVRAWYFFPLHAVLVVVFGLVALLVLDGKTFPAVSDASLGSTFAHTFRGNLRQADVTTLIAAALVLVRFTLNVCSATAAQRCIFVLLEKYGITLREIERIFAFELGPLGTNIYQLGAMFLLLLLIPAQFSAPVAQGAVTWEGVLSLSPAEYSVPLNIAGPGQHFEFLKEPSPEERDASTKRASGLAVIHRFGGDFYTDVDADDKVRSRRWVSSLNEHALANDTKGYTALPINTTVANATVPFFRMSGFQWIDYDDALQHYLDNDNGLFNVTSAANPLTFSFPGNAALLRDEPMHSWLGAWPNTSTPINSATYTIAVLATRRNFLSQSCPDQSDVFGDLPRTKQANITAARGSTTNCYLFARVSVTAGTTQCRDCSVISPGVIERAANSSHPFDAPAADPLAPIVLGMLPETMLTIVTANATYAPTFNNLPGFLAGAFSAAYQASWNDLTDRLALPRSPSPSATSSSLPTTNISTPSYPSRAAVNKQRVAAWTALHALVLAAGALLALLQARCSAPPVTHFAAACLLTDALGVLKSAGATGVRSAAGAGCVGRGESARVGRLTVREEGTRELGARHRVLGRRRDASGGGGGAGGWESAGALWARRRKKTGSADSWASDLTLLPQRSGGSGGGGGAYERVPSPALSTPTPRTSRFSPGRARDGGGGGGGGHVG